jgi:DsbC/DsbD-like thiol-disulfide interchange protein
MNRRQSLAIALGLATGATGARAAPGPFRVSLVDGGWRGEARMAGLIVELDEGWKTYWRMPGEAGMPPEFTWSRSTNVSDITVLFPLPQRFIDGSGETVGYKHRVVFPLRVVPADAASPVTLALDLFFAVCKDICVPARATASTRLEGRDPPATAPVVTEWLARVPQPAQPPLPVAAATLAPEDGKPMLQLTLARPVDDIFVEGDGAAYFRAPDFAADRRSARIAIDNVKQAGALAGKPLNLTVASGGEGLEQTITPN